MPKKYELDVFDSAGEHLATVLVYGEDDDEIDEKIVELADQLDSLDEVMDNDLAFAELSPCKESEIPSIDDWIGEDDKDGEDDEDEDEEDGEGCAAGTGGK